jgi:plastocyanin
MRIRCLWIGILATLLVPVAPALAANQTVTATNANTFTPKTVVINTGDMVTWNNGGGFHNVHFDDNSFDMPASPSSAAWSVSRTFSSPGTFRYYCEAHGGPGGSGMSGTVWVNGPGYARPAAASPLRASLSVAYRQCQGAAQNRTHGPPLAHPSCNPPVQVSDWLTVGTPDANGNPANSAGSATFRALVGNPTTPEDEADFRILISMTDVRNKSGLTDYTGELQVRTPLRITSRNNAPTSSGPFTDPATGDTTFPVTVPCAGTSDTGIGSTCSITTTADALMPGAVPEGKRSIFELGKIEVLDGGADGVATTAPNTVFASQGVFIP